MIKYDSDVHKIKNTKRKKRKFICKMEGYQKPSWISKIDIQ